MTGKKPVYLILGAAGGVGSALARRLAASGARLMLAGKSGERLDALATELGAKVCTLDARDVLQVEGCVTAAISDHGRLDGVVNCVGSLLLKPAHLTRPEEWDETIATNLTSAFATVRAAARAMMEDGGSIVLVASAAAETGLANHEAIAPANASRAPSFPSCCLHD